MVDNLLHGFHLLSPRLYCEQLFISLEESSVLCQPAEQKESSVLCQPVEQKSLEKYVLKEKIEDIIASNDMSWWAQHELLGRWIVRMGTTGFVFLTTSIILVAVQLLGGDVDTE
uniref:Uncharacterized protein n=1 Tax=Leersia perrieri TaxID=77586 RepID=A0A0D9WFX4_9ORYZ